MIKFLIEKFLSKYIFKKKIYTNGVYWIKGKIKNGFVVGK